MLRADVAGSGEDAVRSLQADGLVVTEVHPARSWRVEDGSGRGVWLDAGGTTRVVGDPSDPGNALFDRCARLLGAARG